MRIFLLLINFISILCLINQSFAYICSEQKETDYTIIKAYTPIEIKVEPKKEICLKYEFKETKNKISLSFLKANSYTVEVLIYDSYKNIITEKGQYVGYIEQPYIIGIGNNDFKEIDVSKFTKNVFIIIRETKFYYYFDYMKLYDSEVPISLEENIPFTIKRFMSNFEYNFIIDSNEDITISYSSLTKGLKYVTINDNHAQILYNEPDTKDILYTAESSNLNQTYKINIKVSSGVDFNNIKQEFSIMYCKKLKKFRILNNNINQQIYYLSNNNETQIFLFYINTTENENSNTINFKLDYEDKIKNKNYIDITTNVLNELPHDLDNYEFINNQLESSYDQYSDEYFRFYFKKESQIFILIKVQINILNNYKQPNYFNISYGEEVKIHDLSSNNPIIITTRPYIPQYTKFIVDNSKKYLFYAPYEVYCTLINGDLIQNNKINENFFNEATDLHEINKTINITARVFSKERKINFFYEEYNPNNVVIKTLDERITKAYEQKFEQKDCNGQPKHIIFKYDIEKYSYGQNPLANYWISDGNMVVYYKNNSDFNGTFFPHENKEQELEQETIYQSNTHLDIFTIKCNSPGTFYIRPLKKNFKLITHDIKENSLNNMEIYFGSEIIQLEAEIKNPPPHVYFSILTFSKNNISISPDTPGLFNETLINSSSNYFNLVIDTKLYKMDQMAIKLTSNSNNEIEVIETTDCESCVYQKISNEKTEKNLEINKNNFVIFLDDIITRIYIKFNNLENEKVAYGIVDLYSEDLNYIPIAFNFETTKKEMLGNKLDINIESDKTKNQYKPHRAFIFSVKKSPVPNYNINLLIFNGKNDNEKVLGIILISSIGVSIAILIIFLFIYLKNKYSKRRIDQNIPDKIDSLMA